VSPSNPSYLYGFPIAGEDMVDFCASDGAFLTFIATSVASAVLLAPLSDAQIFALERRDGPDESRSTAVTNPTAIAKFMEDLSRVGAGLKAIQRIVAQGAVCRDNAPH
jgi:hypothetical protein